MESDSVERRYAAHTCRIIVAHESRHAAACRDSAADLLTACPHQLAELRSSRVEAGRGKVVAADLAIP
jgi:hypothetical protein